MISSIFKALEELEKQSALEKSRKVTVNPADRMLAITKETGEIINMVLRLKKAKNMLEVGMSTGYSTIWCAEAISEESGKITTIENNPNKVKRAKENFKKAGVSNLIEIREGTALSILKEMSIQEKYNEFFDCVLLDADKENIVKYVHTFLFLIKTKIT